MKLNALVGEVDSKFYVPIPGERLRIYLFTTEYRILNTESRPTHYVIKPYILQMLSSSPTYGPGIRFTSILLLIAFAVSMSIPCELSGHHGHDCSGTCVVQEKHIDNQTGNHGRTSHSRDACSGDNGGCALPCWSCGCANSIVSVITPEIYFSTPLPFAPFVPYSFLHVEIVDEPIFLQPPRTPAFA
jgi:hypothetical protein